MYFLQIKNILVVDIKKFIKKISSLTDSHNFLPIIYLMKMV